MSYLELHFSDFDNPQLVKTCFNHPLNSEPIISVRGKFSDKYSTFQWSPAVRALSYFFVSLSLNKEYLLAGTSPSFASSLDYAISKEPLWLSEMFSFDSNGESLLKRIINRENSNQKLPGPVVLSLRPNAKRELRIKIYVQDLLLETSSIELLASRLNLEGSKESNLLSTWHAEFYNDLLEEMNRGLTSVNIFNNFSYQQAVEGICKNPSFVSIVGEKVKHLSFLKPKLSKSAMFGLGNISDGDCKKGLNVAIPITIPAAQAIFRYLKFSGKLTINSMENFPHAVEIANQIIDKRVAELPDLIGLGVGPAAKLLTQPKSCGYYPFMLLAGVSHRVVAPKGAEDLNNGHYCMLYDDPSTQTFYMDHLERAGVLNKDRISLGHMEPDEIYLQLASGDKELKSALFFPHYGFNKHHNNCSYLDEDGASGQVQPTILFVREEIFLDKSLLNSIELAIRDAWYVLQTRQEQREVMARSLINDAAYMSAIERFSGIGLAA